jgi:ankyrin repeat protein
MIINSPFGEYQTNNLIHAAYKGDVMDVENYILEGEIDINDTDDSGCTALDYAIDKKDKAMIRLLIKAEGVNYGRR